MNDVQVALYARVSSEQQSEAKTVESQVADLRAKIATMGETLELSRNLWITATVEPP